MNFSSASILLLCIAFSQSATVKQPEPRHIDGFVYLGRGSESKNGVLAKDFYYSTKSATHGQAQIDCRNLGGILTSILTATQNSDLRVWVEAHNVDCSHVGGRRLGSSSTFEWTGGMEPIPMRYWNWQPGQPATGSDCVCIHGTGSLFGWHTCSCTANYYYVCEF